MPVCTHSDPYFLLSCFLFPFLFQYLLPFALFPVCLICLFNSIVLSTCRRYWSDRFNSLSQWKHARTHTHTHTCLAILVRTRTWHLEGCIQPHYQLKCSHTRHSLNWWSWRCCEDRAGCWADYMTLSSSNGRKSTLSLYFSCVVFSP